MYIITLKTRSLFNEVHYYMQINEIIHYCTFEYNIFDRIHHILSVDKT